MSAKSEALNEQLKSLLYPEERKPGQLEDETRAQYYWRILRESIRDTVKLVAKADSRNIVVGHGVHYARKLNHANQLYHVMYNIDSKEYLTIDKAEGSVNIFYRDGRRKDTIDLEEPVSYLLFARKYQRYVGWSDNDEIKLYSSDFELLTECQAPDTINCLVYNEAKGEIVTSSGSGTITSWAFRYAAKHLVARKTVEGGRQVSPGGPFTQLCLEDTASRSQRCYAVCGTGVAVFNLGEGTLLSHKRDLHVRNISSMLFFNPLKLLVTAARDGSIKIWDEAWLLQFVFVGHCGVVSCLAVYPYGPYIVSASHDCSIRVWSLETYDEVEKIDTDEPIDGMGTVLLEDNMFSYTAFSVTLWKVKHIHNLFSSMGSKVTKIKMTDRPDMPPRALCICSDSSARLVSQGSGEVITSLLLDRKQGIMDAVYAQAEETVFAALNNGDLIRATAKNNPCTVQRRWESEGRSEKSLMNCLCLYQYIVEVPLQEEGWGGVLRAVAAVNLNTPGRKSPLLQSRDRTLLIGGRRDGFIAVLDWKTMEPSFEIEAHGFKGVLGLLANPKLDQLISAGKEEQSMYNNVVKVWRVYPFAQEALAPMMTFYCSNEPLHMTVSLSRLCIAFQEPSTATYNVVQYELTDKSRFDHSPDDDPLDSITAVTCCPRMRVFASSSLDGTVRIWDENNTLIRVVTMNAVPHSLCFCNQKGDLLVGVGNHLHRIDHKNYLPKAYQFKMVSMKFPEDGQEVPLKVDPGVYRSLEDDEKKRIKNAHSSSLKFDHFSDPLSKDENEEMVKEQKTKEQACDLLKARDDELLRIRDGQYELKKKPKPPSAIREEAFKKYLDMFPAPYKIHIPKVDNFKPDGPDSAEEDEPAWHREREPRGFFPEPSSIKWSQRKEDAEVVTAREEALRRRPQPPINLCGFIPNSILIRLLWPRDQTDKLSKDRGWRPPNLTQKQMEEIARIHKPTEEEEEEEEEHVITWEDDEDEKEQQSSLRQSPETVTEPEKKFRREPKKEDRRPKKPDGKAGIKEKFGVDFRPMSPRVVLGEEHAESPPPSPPPQEKPVEEKKPSREILKPRKPIEKLISRPKPPPPVKEPSPPPPRSPSPPRPPTPLPRFITQFKGTEWFENFFPNADIHNFPKPWTVTAFVSTLIKLIKIADYGMKTPICDALGTLYTYETIEELGKVIETVYGILNSSTSPKCDEEEQKAFIMSSMRLLQKFDIYDDDFIVEMITQFIDGDDDVRSLVKDIMVWSGLQDPHEYFFKELDSWEVWNMDENSHKKELSDMAQAWVHKWMNSFKSHLKKMIEQLKKGKVQGKIQRRASSLKDPSKGILKKASEEDGVGPPPGTAESALSSRERSREERRSRSGGEEREGVSTALSQTRVTPDRQSPSKPFTVTFDAPPDQSTIDNAQPIEAINYFCEMQLEKSLEEARRAQEEAARAQAQLEAKNTVLILPKIKSEDDGKVKSTETEEIRDVPLPLPDKTKRMPTTHTDQVKTSSEIFEELRREKEKRQKSERPQRERKKPPGPPPPPKPIAVIDSKPSLVRLGETHTSKCHSRRETTLTAEMPYPLPPLRTGKRFHPDDPNRVDSLLEGFTHQIDFPMSTVVMRFPRQRSHQDTTHQPILLTLKSSQKYFVPSHSYIPDGPE